MASYLITGSSRGLGLAIAGLIASKPASEVSKVFASARSETEGVKKLIAESNGRVEFVQLDVTSQESAKKAASQVEQSLNGKGLDVIINNAGVMNYTPNGIENMTDLDDTFKINVTSVHYVTSAFLPLLKKGNLKKVVNISTTLGSITKAPTYALFPVPAYKVSKAALNMLTVQYAQSFAEEGFTFVAVSPGWVQTDLGGSSADLTVEQGSKAVTDIVFRVSKSDTGKFFNVHVPGWEHAEGINQYDGACPPW
ncbi:Short-chain dehydrogenase/reductase SDR [Macrophomina phaseolina MS6]|uniref:Short-chain dehydrogenase/reductase SDR n=2 Tax=Macrophomina phaseolina TaxID=35725 RepID=K2RHJ1_MACPH|nr:Short-chain dehydrogenase/reductase SDR [Macrophomina phaseolina MS6]KAH7052134.1 short-chain dehydrogenase-like protein [Macrophomina phaseolina]